MNNQDARGAAIRIAANLLYQERYNSSELTLAVIAEWGGNPEDDGDLSKVHLELERLWMSLENRALAYKQKRHNKQVREATQVILKRLYPGD